MEQGGECLPKQSGRERKKDHTILGAHPLPGQKVKHKIRYLYRMTNIVTSHKTKQPVGL